MLFFLWHLSKVIWFPHVHLDVVCPKQFCGHGIYVINITHGARTCMWMLLPQAILRPWYIRNKFYTWCPRPHVDVVCTKQFCGHDIYAINISHGSRTCNFAVFCFLLGSSVAMSCYDKAYLNSFMVPEKLWKLFAPSNSATIMKYVWIIVYTRAILQRFLHLHLDVVCVQQFCDPDI